MSGTAGRLALFGGGGFVGGRLAAAAFARGWDVHVVDAVPDPGVPGLEGARWHRADITDADAVRTLLRGMAPDAAVDLAAVADIDRAERERDLARAVNVEAARTIAAACAGAGAWMMYFSSDAVFAGTADRYTEDDPPAPVNYYGRTKAEGEEAVRAAHPGAAVIRISLALGFALGRATAPPLAGGNSFLAGLEAALAQGREVAAPAEEVRTPVDVHTLCACVLELARMRFAGTIHVGSTTSIDRGALTRMAALLLGYPSARINAAPAAVPGRAPRHRNGIIAVEKARALLSTPLLDAEATVRRAVLERR
jgi:dTDP-4-dehydrorhamnose reductase